MGDGTDAVRETTPRVTPKIGPFDDPRAPWWWNAIIRTVATIGIPAAICAFLLYERATVLKEFTQSLQRAVVILEKIASK